MSEKCKICNKSEKWCRHLNFKEHIDFRGAPMCGQSGVLTTFTWGAPVDPAKICVSCNKRRIKWKVFPDLDIYARNSLNTTVNGSNLESVK